MAQGKAANPKPHPMKGKKRPNTAKGKPTIRKENNVEILFELVMNGVTGQSIAKRMGLAPATVYRMQTEPAFKERVKRAREERREAFGRQFEAIAGLGIQAHLKSIQLAANADPEAKDFFKKMGLALSSADSVLDRIGMGRTTKVEQSTQLSGSVAISSEFEGRNPEDLMFYANNGHFPEDAPKVRK